MDVRSVYALKKNVLVFLEKYLYGTKNKTKPKSNYPHQQFTER